MTRLVVRWLRIPAAAAGVVIGVAWVLSLPFNCTITPWGHTLNLCNGGLDVVLRTAVPANDWSVELNSPLEPMRWWFQVRVYTWSPPYIFVRCPLWPFMLAACGIGAAGFVLRQRLTWGMCPRCGYDLRGVAAARCPECGRET